MKAVKIQQLTQAKLKERTEDLIAVRVGNEYRVVDLSEDKGLMEEAKIAFTKLYPPEKHGEDSYAEVIWNALSILDK